MGIARWAVLLAGALGVCGNAFGAEAIDVVYHDGFEAGEPETSSCEDPLVKPDGMGGRLIGWSKMFTPPDGSPVPTYPNSPGFPVFLGADKGSWTSGKFTAQPDQTVILHWERAQAKPYEGYYYARPANTMMVTISPCAGDLRAPVFGATDHLAPGCRRIAYSSSIVTTTRFGTDSTYSYCALVPGQTYYITVSPVDTRDGLDPDEHTCAQGRSADGCDVQARHVKL